MRKRASRVGDPGCGNAEGRRIAAAAKLKERFADLPVLFTSGYSENTGAGRSQVANSEYLQKPYSPMALARAIRRMLDPASKPQQ